MINLSFSVGTHKGKKKFKLPGIPPDLQVGQLFMDLVKQTQGMEFPINPTRPDGSPIQWHFFIEDANGQLKEIFPEQSLQEAGVQEGTVIHADDDADIGAKNKGGGFEIQLDYSTPQKKSSGGGFEVSLGYGGGDSPAATPAPAPAAPAPSGAGAPRFPEAIQHHLSILQQVVHDNWGLITSDYDWNLQHTWGRGWDRIRIMVHGVSGVVDRNGGEAVVGTEHTFEIRIPEQFPDQRPKAVPVTPIWHPNVRPASVVDEGEFCWIGKWTTAEMDRCLERLVGNVIYIIQYGKVRGGDHANMNAEARDWVIQHHGSLDGFPAFQPMKTIKRTEAQEEVQM